MGLLTQWKRDGAEVMARPVGLAQRMQCLRGKQFGVCFHLWQSLVIIGSINTYTLSM